MSAAHWFIVGTAGGVVIVFALAAYLRWLIPPPPAGWMDRARDGEDDTWL